MLLGDALPLNVTSVGITLGLVLYAWGMQRSSLFNVLTAAHHTVFTSLQDAVFVLDDSDKLIQWNEAGRSLLGVPASALLYKRLAGLLAHGGMLANCPTERTRDLSWRWRLASSTHDSRRCARRTAMQPAASWCCATSRPTKQTRPR
ncbi:MAG: PAS domain-containing protein [Chloroflexi bacterium]|nr:PAS domain-containing protein [Chloroflexota bacterium]